MDSPNSKIHNYGLLATKSFIEKINRFLSIIDIIDWLPQA